MIEISNTYVQKETWKLRANPNYVSQISLHDADGKEVYSASNVAHGEKLDVSSFPPGIYSIKLTNPIEETFIRLEKQ